MFDHPLGRGGNRILEAWVGAESRFLWPAALPPLLLPVLLPIYYLHVLPTTYTVIEGSNVTWGVSHQLKIREDGGPGVFSYG